MNNLTRHTRVFIKWMLAAVFLVPALGWAHGAVDTPISRQVKCQKDGGYWASVDGSSIKDKGCRDAALVFPTPDKWAYQFQQWNEVAHLIAAPGYNDPETVKRQIPDNKLCSAGDDDKDGLNLVSADWYRTDVTPNNGMMDVRIIGTAPHVPSFAKVFLTEPGFDPTTSPLTWDKLVLIHTEQLTVAKIDWGNNLPALPGASGYFQFKVPVPSGQTGKATLFVQWQRIDPAGEGFYNCSDINIVSASVPGSWFDLGQFIDAVMNKLKAGDKVHYRILDNSPANKEVVDITLPIDASNLDPKIWGQQLASQISPAVAKVGEKLGSNNIVFNTTNPGANSVYAVAKGYSQAMAIIPGDGTVPVDPRPPLAVIKSHPAVKSGESFTMDGTASTIYNAGAAGYQWHNDFQGGDFHQSTATFTAPTVQQPQNVDINLRVYDSKNKTSAATRVTVTVNPSSGGGEHPAYKEGTPYAAGDIVSNNGKNYKCKPAPFTGWCAGAAWAYAPGTGSDWASAWDAL